MKKNILRILAFFITSILSQSCTHTITMVHTQGQDNVLDETDARSPSTSVNANLNIPL